MFSKDLELSIGQCYKDAREQRHEFMTVEHLLLALLENPSASAVLRACGADSAKLGKDLKNIIVETVPVLPHQRRARHAADAGLPACLAARRVPRAVLGPQGSHRRQRAGGDLRREGFACGVLPQPAGSLAPGRGQLHLARHRQDRPGKPAANGRRARQGRRGRRRAARQSAHRFRDATSTSSPSRARSIR